MFKTFCGKNLQEQKQCSKFARSLYYRSYEMMNKEVNILMLAHVSVAVFPPFVPSGDIDGDIDFIG
ncbi:MAG: hypothetical protein ACRC9X_05075 [Bacteroidales bacterium]